MLESKTAFSNRNGGKKGFERGEKIGRKQGILQTEKKMKQCNTYIEFIQKITGLPLQK